MLCELAKGPNTRQIFTNHNNISLTQLIWLIQLPTIKIENV